MYIYIYIQRYRMMLHDVTIIHDHQLSHQLFHYDPLTLPLESITIKLHSLYPTKRKTYHIFHTILKVNTTNNINKMYPII